MASSAFALRANEAGIAQDADALGGLSAESYPTKDELPGLCVTAEALSDALTTLSSEAPYFTAGDVEVVLVDGGYVTLTDLAAVAITGSYLDLSDTPAVLDSLTVNDSGELVYAGMPLINAAGEWIGSPTGLVGPPGEKGADGASGVDGISVVSAEVNSAGELVIVLSDGTITTSAPLTGPKGAEGAPGPAGVDGVSGQDGISVASAEVNSRRRVGDCAVRWNPHDVSATDGTCWRERSEGRCGTCGSRWRPRDSRSRWNLGDQRGGEFRRRTGDCVVGWNDSRHPHPWWVLRVQQGPREFRGLKGDKGEPGEPGIQG